MVRRKIITIDEDKCNGCGQCVDACHEGAIQMIEGKAKLVSDIYCDGLGDCLGECPVDAITIIEREAAEFDEDAVKERQSKLAAPDPQPCGCPGMALQSFCASEKCDTPAKSDAPEQASVLTHWPVQLHLVPINAPFFADAHLLIAADCVPFAFPSFHQDLLAGKALAIGCPKLDDAGAYVEKLTEIFRQNAIREITVAYMEVPCCTGLVRIVESALAASGKQIPCHLQKVSVRGKFMAD